MAVMKRRGIEKESVGREVSQLPAHKIRSLEREKNLKMQPSEEWTIDVCRNGAALNAIQQISNPHRDYQRTRRKRMVRGKVQVGAVSCIRRMEYSQRREYEALRNRPFISYPLPPPSPNQRHSVELRPSSSSLLPFCSASAMFSTAPPVSHL